MHSCAVNPSYLIRYNANPTLTLALALTMTCAVNPSSLSSAATKPASLAETPAALHSCAE